MAVFWVVEPCSLVEDFRRFRYTGCLHHHPPDDGGSNVDKRLPSYTALQHRRQPSSDWPPWQPQQMGCGLKSTVCIPTLCWTLLVLWFFIKDDDISSVRSAIFITWLVEGSNSVELISSIVLNLGWLDQRWFSRHVCLQWPSFAEDVPKYFLPFEVDSYLSREPNREGSFHRTETSWWLKSSTVVMCSAKPSFKNVYILQAPSSERRLSTRILTFGFLKGGEYIGQLRDCKLLNGSTL